MYIRKSTRIYAARHVCSCACVALALNLPRSWQSAQVGLGKAAMWRNMYALIATELRSPWAAKPSDAWHVGGHQRLARCAVMVPLRGCCMGCTGRSARANIERNRIHYLALRHQCPWHCVSPEAHLGTPCHARLSPIGAPLLCCLESPQINLDAPTSRRWPRKPAVEINLLCLLADGWGSRVTEARSP